MIDEPLPVVKPKVRLKMADVARLAGVSVSSVSRALADSPLIPKELRERIQAIARENGYVVNQAARNLRLQTTQTIGLILPMGPQSDDQLTDSFLLEMIGALADEVVRRGYDLLLSKVNATSDGWLFDLTHSHRFDGLLVLGQSDQHVALQAVGAEYPAMVVWGEKMPRQSYASVGVDNVLGGRLAARHMVAGGCRDILFVGPSGVPEADARYTGYCQGLASTLASTLAQSGAPQRIESRFNFESALTAVREVIARKQTFDGLFCASDIIAQAALTALAEAGLSVPGDVAVCGFDDIGLARSLSPGLTTVRQDRATGARHMVDILFRRLNGIVAPSVQINAELVVRGTTRGV
ncbi:HTH-type transcriptional repressor cytR [Asticcacaulis biprosthecium C19]|uniref:HTH-type transcriptional repressor cytR n=1 Tax=Asticcacaulis biprosthecium C19 TaxID=715226 RepID=F4QK11_9CAUL|nr:LacI family DNA-binding transcriptional regulator [Asticcacaulis biprosthecium]EGF92038.1 HTH-type transcriptional repressor cytR [Asticcacaulis biprosthecium C19]